MPFKQVAICTIILLFPITCAAFDYFQPLPQKPLVPDNNPQSEAKIQLGRMLFYDTILAIDLQSTCNHCHNLLLGGDDDQPVSTGYKGRTTKRSAPTLWNIGLQTVLFWDGRQPLLEDAIVDHLSDVTISGTNNPDKIIGRIAKSKKYKINYAKAFNGSSVSLETTAKALSSFLRSLLAHNSPFDRYMRGDTQALTKAALRGKETFTEKGCLACHFGVNFAGPAPGPAMTMGDGFYELFPNNLGSKFDNLYKLTEDKGRFEFSGKKDEIFMWRVPPLRNIAVTGPYFHNGSVATLHEAVKVMAKTQFNHDLDEQQISDIVSFLQSLTGEIPESALQDEAP